MKVLAVDPGESTGWSVTEDSLIVAEGTHTLDEFTLAVAYALGVWPEWASKPPVDDELLAALRGIDHIVIEDWVLYEWELQNLAWDKCRTARGIGALELSCVASETPYTLQPALIKDTAKAAGVEDLYTRPLHENRHQNDSLQHQVVWHLKRRLPPIRRRQEVGAGTTA